MQGRTVLGRYEIQRLLGEGGMGKVYLARQLDLQRQVVIKVMHEHVAADAKFRDRFQRETLLMARFQHPYGVTLYDAVLDSADGPCIIMEYVKGETLDVMLERNQRLSPARVGRLIGQLCEVLQAAHSQGIIHRDLKPGNLMLVDADTPYEKIKVMDFGLAKLVEAQSLQQIVDSGHEFAVGTPAYMCPEQIRGEEMDHRGDLYSVGVMVYELLTGRLPFDATSTMDMLLAHATDDPIAMNRDQSWVPAPIEKVVAACLAKKAANRPASARDLAQMYAKALEEEDTEPAATAEKTAEETDELGEVPPPVPDDPTAVVYQLQAWMPEAVASHKLRGFVSDLGGVVLESEPGRIRVRLGTSLNGNRRSILGWLGMSAASYPIDLELRMHRPNAKQQNQLWITAILRSAIRPPAGDWRQRAGEVFVNLRGYLIGHTEATHA